MGLKRTVGKVKVIYSPLNPRGAHWSSAQFPTTHCIHAATHFLFLEGCDWASVVFWLEGGEGKEERRKGEGRMGGRNKKERKKGGTEERKEEGREEGKKSGRKGGKEEGRNS
jgi:hypothetical protein